MFARASRVILAAFGLARVFHTRHNHATQIYSTSKSINFNNPPTTPEVKAIMSYIKRRKVDEEIRKNASQDNPLKDFSLGLYETALEERGFSSSFFDKDLVFKAVENQKRTSAARHRPPRCQLTPPPFWSA